MIKTLPSNRRLLLKGFLVACLILIPGFYNLVRAQPTYCTSYGNTSYQTSVRLVNFNTINNTSAKPSGYSDYTSLVTDVIKSNSYNLTVNVNTDGNYMVYARAWIDWNNDGDFIDAGESFDLGSVVNTPNGPTSLCPLSITIPAGAITGTTRMRISAKYNAYPTSCETNFDGEVEDYTLNVVDPLMVYYSTGNDPTLLSNWNSIRTGGGSSPTSFSATNQTFVVQPSYSMTAGSPWGVSGTNTNVLVENGAVLTADAVISFSTNTTFQVDNGATYNHNVDNNAVWDGAEVIGPTSTINYGHAGPQDVAPLLYGNLVISGGNVKTLLGSVTVEGTLSLNDGNISLGSADYNLTLGTLATITSSGAFNNTHMIVCGGSGYLIKEGTNPSDFLRIYPVGTGNNYTPFEITALTATVGGTGSISVRAVAETAPGPPSAVSTDLMKYWSISTTNISGISADIRLTYINPEEVGLGGDQTKYVPFLYSGGAWTQPGIYSAAGINPMTVSGISNIDGQWTARMDPVSVSHYSYKTGDWHDPETWTSDPSGTLQIGNQIPGNGSVVVILTDRTVTMSQDVTETGLSVTVSSGAFLDQSVYGFTGSIYSLSGQGTFKLASINFPTVSYNTLINTGGGTVEYYNNADFTLPVVQGTYNNLIINTSGVIATQMSDIALNGNLYVKSGTLRINDNTSTGKRSLAVNGNVTVDNGASITVGNGVTNTAIGGAGGTAPYLNYYLNFHTVIIRGDFTNNGTVRFTNLNHPVFNAFPPTVAGATSGAASVYFEGASNNNLICNGITDFYNLILNKGTDQTYSLSVISSAYSNFRLFGANTAAAEAVSGNPTMRKALWIYSGTLILKGNVVIPSLSEGTLANAHYYIPARGALVADGVDVVILSTADDYREVNVAYGVSATGNAVMGVSTTGTYSALYVFGRLQINKGFLSTKESGGIVTNSTASGQIVISDGIVDAKQLLSSTGSASYSQSGGLFILRGRFKRTPLAFASMADLTDVSTATLNTTRATSGINSSYGSFNLETTANIYNVSGGTIRIYDATNIGAAEAFDVKSSAENINVTGGMLEMIPTTGTGTDATDYSIHTTAPVYNLTISRVSSTSTIRMSTAVTILNNLNISSGDLNANNNNLTVRGGFTLEAGTTYTTGTNITTLNGASAQTLTINHASPLSLSSFTVDKPAGVALTLAGSQDTIKVSSAFRLIAGTMNDGGKAINISGNVLNSGIATGTGRIILDGSSPQTIAGDGVFGNLELTNNAVSPVSLLDDMTIDGSLTFSVDNLLDIGTFNLHLNSSASIVNSGAARFVQSAGNAGDGGLSRSYGTIDNFTFPVGVAGKYTPATIGFTSAPATYGSVTIIPVDYEHPVTTINGESLTYFWRVKSTGFAGIPLNSVFHSFVYSEIDVAGTETDYVPALHGGTSYTWYSGQVSDINTTTNTISDWTLPTNSTSFLDADYTAGSVASFGTPKIFYSYQSGLWSSTDTWSLSGHTVNDPPLAVPGAIDIVIIGDNDSIWLDTETPPLPVNDGNPAATYYQRDKAVVNCATLQIEAGSVLDIQNNPGSTFVSVLSHPNGNGKLRLTTRDAAAFDSPEPFVYPGGDFSEFSVNDGITEFYTINPQAGTYYIMPSNADSYGTVILTPLRGSNIILPNLSLVTINGDLICNGSDADAWLTMTWNGEYGAIVPKTVNVEGDLVVSGGSFGFIYNGAILQQINIAGDVHVAPGAGIDVWSSSTGNTMSIGGSIFNNSDNSTAPYATRSLVRFLNGGNRCNVIFTGNNSAVVTNDPAISTTPVTAFNTVTINKGNSPDSTLTWNIGGTLTTPVNAWLTLQNGTLVYDRSGDFRISTSTNFTIPSTAGLTLNTPSNVFIANTTGARTLFLNGKLKVLTGGGNVYIGPSGNTVSNADIEYSGNGASLIEIQSGNVFVNGQIRRPLASTNGTLTYRQSGGNVIIYGNNSSATKAKLEVLNKDSEFTMSGGRLTIVRGGGTTFGDLYLRPSSGEVTGGTIAFTQSPAAGTVIDAVQSYLLDANISLNDLEVTGKTEDTSRNAELSLIVSPLVLNGSLTISNERSYFASNDRDVTIRGNMNNSGNYEFGVNRTIFDGGVQAVTGASATNFYDLEASSVISLTMNGSFAVNNDLQIVSGNLVLGSGLATVSGNLTNNGAYTDDNVTGGVSLGGNTQQVISGTGSFARLVLDNPYGARIDNGIALQHDLVISRGILDINKYQLLLSQNSLISGTGFNATKMIKSDGVSSSRGVLKYFQTGPQTFTFPIGVPGKYTPALLTITASSTVGSIRINPVNDNHPSVTDPLNTLDYYWQTESVGISGFNASMQLSYKNGDVYGDEASYVAARLVLPGSTWDKALPGAATDNVNESDHTVTFYYSGSNNLNGDYTAGTDTAIPDEVSEYITNVDGVWSDPNIWTAVGASPPCPVGGPQGSNVIIDHVVTTDINFISVLNTTINNELRVVSPTYGHNLGNVSGNGKIYLEGGNLPGGTYTDFTDCSGNGTIEYGGTGSYIIVSGLYTSVPNLNFSGTGTRILPNFDLTVCKSLVIDGPLLDNSVNNRKLTILGTLERYNTGAFRSGTGSYPAATVVFGGTSAQSIGGPTGDLSGADRLWNVEINNSAGLTVSDGGLLETGNQLILSNGIISTSASGRLVLLSTSSSSVVPLGGSDISFVNGPLTKYILNGDAFEFPLGRGTIKGHKFTLTSTAGSTVAWTAEYLAPNNTATSIAPPLEVSSTLEYWSVSSAVDATARLKIGWDPQSDITPLITENGLADIRVAEYISGLWTELPSLATGNNNIGEVETTGDVSISTTPADFTIASISGTLARASFSSFDPICGSGGILVSFISFTPISLNYILSYTIDGVSQTDLTVTSLPFTLPANLPGVYKLTGFRFNGGTGIGVVDGNTVTVYELPTVSDAGANQSLCGVSTTTLAGNDPLPYSGLWSVISGAGGSFVNSVQHNTVFNGVLGVSYTLRWTISNGPCSSYDDVIISFPVVASQPGAFTSATTQVCRGTAGYVYTVPFVSGVTYNWSYSGTGHTINGTGNSVTVDFDGTATGGTLSVTATNACGTSPARTVNISVRVASFSYPGSPYCQNQADPLPVLAPAGVAGTFSSTPGLVFLDTATGQIDLSASVSGVYTVTNTVDASVCGGMTSTNTITISGQSWTGSVSAEWDNAANWSCGFVPYPVTQVIIPDVATEPVISSGITGETRSLVIDPGSSLIVAGGTVRIYDSVVNNGIFDASDGTVEFCGSMAQSAGAGFFTGNTVRNLTVNNSAGVTLLDALNVRGVVLINNGSLASDGHLTLLSDAVQTALIDGSGSGTVTGDVTMQRYLPSKFGYKYFSSPFTAATVSEFGDDMDLASSFPLFYRYDESRTSSGWVAYTTGTAFLNPLEGYAVNFGASALPYTVDVTGEVNNGSLSVTLNNHDNTYTKGMNLVGNPYPSPVDWNAAGWTKTNIDNALYYFRAGTTDEFGGTYSSYVNGVSSDGTATNIIPSMQAFLVHVSDGSFPVTGTLGVTNSVRINDLTHPFLKSAEASDRFLVRIDATFTDDATSADPMVIYFDDSAAPAFDPELDALKIFNTDYLVTNIYSVLAGGDRLSINALPPQADTAVYVPLGLTSYRVGEVCFRIRDIENLPEDVRIMLRDAVTGANKSMLSGGEYRVNLTSGEYSNRFMLAFLKNTTDIDDPKARADLFSAYTSEDRVVAVVSDMDGNNGLITVYDLKGRIVFTRRVFETGIYDLRVNAEPGIYLVNYSSGKLVKTVKLIIGVK